MESYRMSSKLREKDREYLIQTTNDVALSAVTTTVYVDGVPGETISYPHPTEVDPQEVLSLVKLTHNDKKKEIEILLKAVRRAVHDGEPETMLQIGTALFYKQFYREAAELLNVVTGLAPNHHQAYNNLGMALLALGRTDEAVQVARTAVQQRPGYADYRNNLGDAYLSSGDAMRAISEFEQAVNINLYYAEAYFNLALAHILRQKDQPDPGKGIAGFIDKVTGIFKKVSLIAPDYRLTSGFEEGVEALKKADFGRALQLFNGVRSSRKELHRQEFASFYMRYVLHPEWVDEKLVNERIQYLEVQLQKNPTYVDLQAEVGRCYLELSLLSWQKSLEHFRSAGEKNPSLEKVSLARKEAGRVYELMKDAISKIAGKA